jgi:magnesium transporter
VDKIEDGIDLIEDEVFESPDPALLEQIFSQKRAILHLRRVIAPQREVLNKLARGDYGLIGEGERIFYRDVYDHLVRLHDIVEGLRDLAGSALDTYLSALNNRMNEVMKILAIITTLFMPVSFLAGFFGMNFFQPTRDVGAWTGETAFYLMLAASVIIPVGMYLWMHSRKWM